MLLVWSDAKDRETRTSGGEVTSPTGLEVDHIADLGRGLGRGFFGHTIAFYKKGVTPSQFCAFKIS